jgi:osomolarity two-component system response regulator SKN7
MDDVLPKPFTRKSLLDMLEKHLVHLKTIPQGMETSQPTATVPMAAQTSATHSVKEDSSPGQSPATSMNNWQSPGQFQGLLQQVQPQYVPARPPHRRQISELSNAADNPNFAKRPRIYAQPSQPMINTAQATRTG